MTIFLTTNHMGIDGNTIKNKEKRILCEIDSCNFLLEGVEYELKIAFMCAKIAIIKSYTLRFLFSTNRLS